MSGSLGQCGLWSPDRIDVRLSALIERVGETPSRLTVLQEAAAFEGAQIVHARPKAGRPDICTTEVATSVPEDCQLSDFFEEVKEFAKLVAADCDLDVGVV